MPTCDTCQFVKKVTGRPSHSHFLVILIKMVYPKKYKKIVHSDPISPVLHSSAAEGSPSDLNVLESQMSDETETVTISRGEWQKMTRMLEKLESSQNELSRNQAKLIVQLSRANERIQQLEAEKAALVNDSRQNANKSNPTRVHVEHRAPLAAAPHSVNFTYRVKQVPPPAQNQPKAGNQSKKTWAEIAAAPRPKMSDVSDTTQGRLRQSLALLEISSPEPKPVAVYFRNIKRARLGQVRKALRQMFTHPWAVLGLCFVGKSVLEIVCHEGLVDQLVAKLRIIGATHLRKFDIFGDNLKNTPQSDTGDRQLANLERAQARLQRLIETCPNRFAKSWYSKMAKEVETRVAAKYQAAHDDETSVSSESGYDTEDVVEASPTAAGPSNMDVEPSVEASPAAGSMVEAEMTSAEDQDATMARDAPQSH